MKPKGNIVNQRSYEIAFPNPYCQLCQKNKHVIEETLIKMQQDLCLNMRPENVKVNPKVISGK